MPQWNRDRSPGSYPDERWQSICPAEAVILLLRYDHHTVWIQGRQALLLTYPWAAEERADSNTARPFEVSFTYAAGHPSAPREVQAVVDRLVFAPVANRDVES